MLALSSGTRLGSYEILAPIGKGGMGEVYRARDTRLGRDVAVKVLPEELFEDKERVARFEREAKLLAALNHPGIAAIYSFEEIAGRHLLVQELLEGETLRDALGNGPMAAKEAVEIAAQIARGLAAAHGKGIVHRDLKPENVFLTRDGRVKLLDFGLAKITRRDDPAGSTSAGTLSAASEAGVVLGTVAYMSPEQVRAEPVDHRSDIFSFGTIVYEIVSGKNPFLRDTSPETMTAILKGDLPQLSEPPVGISPSLSLIVARCLEKRPEARFQSAADLTFALEAFSGASSPPATRGSGRPLHGLSRWMVAGAFAAGVALTALAAAFLRTGTPHLPLAQAVRLSVAAPSNGAFAYWVETSFLAMSPDGSQLAYVAWDRAGDLRGRASRVLATGGRHVWLRPLSALQARQVAGTEEASSVFWSPDGHSIAFFAEGKLKRLDLPAGSPVTVCDVAAGVGRSGTWGGSGDILFASVQGEAIYRVSASGGAPVAVLKSDPSRGEMRVAWPWFLPDGERFLYLLRLREGWNLMLAEPGRPARALTAMASRVQYADPGYLVFAREGALLGQRFDWRSGRLTGGPFSIAERVRHYLSPGSASFSTSRTGALAYQPQGDINRLVWFDRTGREVGIVGAASEFITAVIAPDGRQILFDRTPPGTGTEVWSFDLERTVETRVTTGPDAHVRPLWLPGGKSVAYSIGRGGPPQLFRRDLATGKEEELLPGGGFQEAEDVSPDGRTLIYSERTGRGPFDFWMIPLSGQGKPTALLQSPFNKDQVRFSPDGRFIAFISDESGKSDVYVTTFPVPGERIRISTGGARLVRWSREGDLLFLSSDLRMTSVPVRTSPSLQLGAPTTLFVLKGDPWRSFDVSPDGKRFLAIVPEVVADQLPLSVVVNWTSEVEK